MEKLDNTIKPDQEKELSLEKIKIFLLPAILRRFNNVLSKNSNFDKNLKIEYLRQSIKKEIQIFIDALALKDNTDDYCIVSENDINDEKSINDCVIKNIENLSSMLLSNYDINYIGKSVKQYFIEKKPDRMEINELVFVEIKKNYENDLRLHLLFPLSGGPKNMWNLFNEAMTKIGHRIKNGEFENINKIVANNSWIVEKHPDLVKKAGFNIKLEDKNTAEISKKDFLERYGN